MKKKWIILLSLVLVLIGIRIALPYLIKDYVNKVINDIEGHRGGVEDIDLSLIRGAYVINNLKIEKIGEKNPVPFVDIDKIDLSLQWKSLFKGKIVGEVDFHGPRLNFTDDSQPTNDSTTSGSDTTNWVEALKELMPLQINKLSATNGEIHFHNFTSEPPVDLYLNNIYLVVTNIRNVENKNHVLPSSLLMRCQSIGEGKIDLDMRLNLLKIIPDLDGNLKFEGINAPALNDFSKEYGKFDVEKGTLNFYSEMVLNDGNISGYLKPLFKDLKVVNIKKDLKEGGPLQTIWEAVVGLFAEGLENQPKDQLATKIPLTGSIDSPKPAILPTIWNILKNAFIKALESELDNQVKFGEGKPQKK